MADTKRKRKPLTPEQKKHQAEYFANYRKENCKQIRTVLFPKEADLYEVWQSIPNKHEFIVSCLRNYQKTH